MELDELESEYERWSEEHGRAVVALFIEAAQLGVSLDDKLFHPERPSGRSKAQSPEVRAANEGPVDWASRVQRRLGRLKIDIIIEAARQGIAADEIAARTKVPVENVKEVLRVWQPGPSAEGPN